MTTTLTNPANHETAADRSAHLSLTRPRLPRWAPLLVAVLAGCASAILTLGLGWGFVSWAVLGVALYGVALPVWSRLVENPRAAKDRLVTTLVWVAFSLALLPLFSLVWTVVKNGAPALSAEFFTYSMRNVVGEGGGIYHAILGTLLVTLASAVISVPVGLMTAIYLVEYGGGRMARSVTFLVDVMTGIPSIVAGLFAYALFVLFFGEGVRMGFGGAVALSLLMIPVVVRSSEEMLKLVPHELREASYALGVPRWRTVLRVVLPTAASGLVTATMLAVARAAGETAPLLFTSFGNRFVTGWTAYDGPDSALPLLIYRDARSAYPEAQARAWAGALVLVGIVLVLTLVARLLTTRRERVRR